MTERYTAAARQALLFAQEEARSFGHRAIGNEHLLLGLLRSDGGTAWQALESVGMKADRTREDIRQLVGKGDGAPFGQIPFNPKLRRVIDIAGREAMSLGREEVGTEHLLLALLAESEGPAAKVLSGVANEAIVREAVMTAMENPPPDTLEPEPQADVPAAVSVRVGDDVHALLRRAAGLALAEDATSVSVDHVRRALTP
jgi:ATP-dependent Clp protease ATP-binding subunit ClpC